MAYAPYSARCNHCSFEAIGNLSPVGTAARMHEASMSRHRVTVWDSPTSQIPRSLWTELAPPEAVSMPNEADRENTCRAILLETFDPEDGELDAGYLADGFLAALREGVPFAELPWYLLGYASKEKEYDRRIGATD